ncbi:hypothetical protein AB0P21_00245 [Kribbella sp. NPDC056861]|uniref:hypothetical protein n=1 Tax=Kribbella sp. NPDC056861 TaxID=3154857 RepID=UPI00343398AB
MRGNVKAMGLSTLYAPVRPNGKRDPRQPMTEYIREVRDDGLPFDRTGEVVVPQALVPVHCDVEHDHAVYVEPNVWVRHDL